MRIINKKYLNAILTMESALYYYSLIDVIPEKEFLALKRDNKKITDSRLKSIYYQDKFFNIEKSTLLVNGVEIKIYDKEKMQIELVKNKNSLSFDYYKKIAEYISKFAIKNYLYEGIMKEVF